MLLTACSEYITRLFLGVWALFRALILWSMEDLPLYERVRSIAVLLGVISEPPPPFLPLELEYMILGHLRDDLRTLRTCSLVCKDWQPTARKYLFRTLCASGQEELETLPSLLASAPDIRTNVQILILNGARLDVGHLVSLQALMKLIASMPRLCELDISDVPFFMDSGVVDTPYRQSLRHLRLAASCCQRQTFLCLMNIIVLFSSIDKLELCVEDDNQDAIEGTLPTPEQLVQEGMIPTGGPVEIHALEALELEPHWLPILYASLRAIGTLSSTTSGIFLFLSYDVVVHGHALSVDDETDVRALLTGYGSFIRQLGRCVRGLELHFFYPIVFGHTYFAGNWDILGLSACTNLEYLKLDVSAGTLYFEPGAADMMSDAWSAYLELMSLVPWPRLQVVSLSVAVADMKNDPVFSMDWGRLEDALHRLPALETFLLDVFFLVSKWSLEPFSDRLGGLGTKLMCKTSAMAPGHGLGDQDHDDDGE